MDLGVQADVSLAPTNAVAPSVGQDSPSEQVIPFAPQNAGIANSEYATTRNTTPQPAPQSGRRNASLDAMPTATQEPGLGLVIASLRRERGWTILDLSRRAGINRSIIERLEGGSTRKPFAPTVKALADAFGLTVAQLEAGGK